MTSTRSPTVDAAAHDEFLAHRRTVFGVAYRILGRVGDAQDVTQDVWLAWATQDRSTIGSPRAYLVRTTARLALRAAEAERDTVTAGVVLPDPILTDDRDDLSADLELREDVSLALIHVLQLLTPLERVVYILHEVFALRHDEIARVLDRTPAAVRQLSHRARDHVTTGAPRYELDVQTHTGVTEAFVRAARGGDIPTLMRLLAPDITLNTDAGGLLPAARFGVRTRERMLQLLTGTRRKYPIADMNYTHLYVNGRPGALLTLPGIDVVLVLSPDEHGLIRRIDAVVRAEGTFRAAK